jgi:DNA-binding SARP family transcriptional activator
MIQIRLLGPVAVEADIRPIALHGVLEMALLARLALEPGRPVFSERLIDDLWGERVGRDPASSLWTLVRRLRVAFGADSGLVVREGRSYALAVQRDQVDIGRLEILLDQAHDRSGFPSVDRARGPLREALGLWRGEPLAGLESIPFYRAEEARLTAARLALIVELADADLVAGDHAKVVSELEAMVVKYPFEERLWARLMTALYRCGSQTAALRTGSKLRSLLVEQLGIAPSQMIQSLEQRILAQDPTLDWSAPEGWAGAVSRGAVSRGAVPGSGLADPGPSGAAGSNGPGLLPGLRGPQPTGAQVGSHAALSPGLPDISNNFPRYLSTFIGRQAELADIRYLFSSFGLITLTGPGGSGKTRLALRAAAEMWDRTGDSACFVDLAPVADPGSVLVTVARTLSIGSQAGPLSLELFADILSDQSVLIVLDNCEHLVAACAGLAFYIQQRCHRVRLVATSRQPLGVDGERVYRVRPLTLPPKDVSSVDDLAGSDAVELLVERARTHGSDFTLDDATAPLVASICRRLGAARELYEEAIAAAEGIGATWVLPMFSSCLGLVLLGLGEFADAAQAGRDSLIAGRRQGRRSGEAALAIFVLACCATAVGDYGLAVRLSGAHDILEADLTDSSGNSAHYWMPEYREEQDANRRRLAQAFGTRKFEEVYRAGRQLSFQQAVDLAVARSRAP